MQDNGQQIYRYYMLITQNINKSFMQTSDKGNSLIIYTDR
jgi:hypothetical protein